MAYTSIKPEKPVYVSGPTHKRLQEVSREIEMPMQDIASEAILTVLSNAQLLKSMEVWKEGQRRKRWYGAFMKDKTWKAQKHVDVAESQEA